MDRKYKILVVDDDPQELILIGAILRAHNYDMVSINDGRIAIGAIKKETPDLILLDIMMPAVDGYTILKEIKGDDAIKNIPVIMVTALDQDGNKVIANICGAFAYVTKPINSKHLIEIINRSISG